MKLNTRTVLAALAYTGAQQLATLARKLAPALPERIYVTGDLWCYLPDCKHIVLTRSSTPEMVITIHRYAGITVAKIEDPDGEPSVLVLLNHRETPYAMLGRDFEGYPVDPEDYDIPRSLRVAEEQPPADMDALIRNARDLPDPSRLN